MQVRAFLQLLAVAGGAFAVALLREILRSLGLGGIYPLYLGISILSLLVLLAGILLLAKEYGKPFQAIDRQLSGLLEDGEAPIQLPKELSSTEQKLRELKVAMETRLLHAQMAEQQKNDLVMYLAHDIRTPLTSVIGYLSLLDEAKDMPEAQREKYTHITLEKACRLEKMINEFFEIARYSLQQIHLNRETVDLCYLLVQLTDEMLPVLAKHGHRPVIQMETEDLTVYGDREKLARVFNNILKNGAAYSDPNTELVISAQRQGPNVEISFTNQGEEIAPEQLEKLFDKLYRMDEARSADSGGTGLGLAIAKEIVVLHGGRIWARSAHHTVTIVVSIPGGED